VHSAQHASQLKNAIYISSGFSFVVFVAFSVLCLVRPQNPSHPSRCTQIDRATDDDPKTASCDQPKSTDLTNLSANRKRLLIAITCLYIHLAHGLEVAVAGLLPVFAVKCALHLSTSSSSMLLTMYWTCFTLARALAIPISVCLRPARMITFNLIVVTMANLIMFPFADRHEWILWLGTALHGFGK
jgi:fucose permease